MTRGNPEQRSSRDINRHLVERLAGQLDFSAYPLRTASAGQVLARAGTGLAGLPLLVSGAIDAVVHVGEQGQQIIPISFEAGELVLVSALFSDNPLHVDLVAVQDVALRWVPIADIEQRLQQSRSLLVLLARFLAQRLREVQFRERGWMERGVTERVCSAIARVMRDTPVRSDGTLMLDTTHEQLAARCGVSRPKLSLELKRLEQAGQLLLHRSAIEIVHPEHFLPLR